MRRDGQAGMTFLEILISLGVLGVIIAAGSLKLRTVRESLERTRLTQTADALQSYLRAALAERENVTYSAQFLGSGPLKSCLRNGSNCSDGIQGQIAVYLVGDAKRPITGSGVRYSRDGVPCFTKNCGPLSVDANLRLFCSAGGYLKTTCSSAQFMAMQYTIRDQSRGNVALLSDTVEVSTDEAYSQALDLSCGSGMVMLGIGLNGRAVCASFASLNYGDSGTMKPGDFTVKPQDCRPTPTSGDEKYVAAIGSDGVIQCADKTW